MSATFLSEDDIATLPGCKTRAKQISALRRNGIPFFLITLAVPLESNVDRSFSHSLTRMPQKNPGEK